MGFGGGKFLGEKGEGEPGAKEMLLKDSTHMRVRCIHSQGDSCPGLRVSEEGNRGQEELGSVEGGVKVRGLLKRFTWTLEGVGERS